VDWLEEGNISEKRAVSTFGAKVSYSQDLTFLPPVPEVPSSCVALDMCYPDGCFFCFFRRPIEELLNKLNKQL
jgi:hypothetical protein